jgi:hypothetical protein
MYNLGFAIFTVGSVRRIGSLITRLFKHLTMS